MKNPNSSLSISLVDVAMGRKPADLVIHNGRWVCVQSGEIIPNTDIAIYGERIAYVGPDASHTVGKETVTIEAHDKYLVPGLLDGHMHVESGMLTVTEFVRAVIPHGTTGMFADPHEIANVLGLRGVRLMVDEAAQQPIHVWVQVPSCVPSAPGFETPGASLGPSEIAEAMRWKGIVGLGEMMNFPGVINGNEKMHAEMAEARDAGKVISGHYASQDLGLPFHGYAAGGPEDDHEGTQLKDAVARVRQGMKVMVRYGSGWRDVAEGVRAITEMGIDSRHFILCTDDSHCETLVNEGHVNLAVKQAMANRIPPITAIQMATLNVAEHFGLAREVGMIAPGRFADILIVNQLEDFDIHTVIGKGCILTEGKYLVADWPAFLYPDWATRSIHLGKELQATDFRLPTSETVEVTANVIGVVENQAPTQHLRYEVPVENGEVHIDLRRDISKVAVVERHNGSGRVQVGLVHGFGLTAPCAIASTVAHDSHNMIVVGTDETCMAIAANHVASIGGGQVVVKQGETIGKVALPIAGLMSNERAEVVAHQAASVLEGFRECGCLLNNPNMQLSLLALVVIPDLRISDLGLVDVQQFKFVPVLEKRELINSKNDTST
jgi:adenine deaminase